MNTTAVVVNYNTPELLRAAISSIRKFYAQLPIIIVDGSEVCTIKELAQDPNILICHPRYNIGHGLGLEMGIKNVTTKNILVFDSDIEMLKPCIELMEIALKEDVYGVGLVVQVDETGHNVDKGIPYLHPHFALINKRHHIAFVHSGAPALKAMRQLNNNKNLRLINMDVSRYVLHKERGTRVVVDEMERKGQIGKNAPVTHNHSTLKRS